MQVAKIKGRDEIAELLAEYSSTDVVDFPELSQYHDNYIDSSIGGDTPAYAVLIAKDGEILFTKAAGHADIENQIKLLRWSQARWWNREYILLPR